MLSNRVSMRSPLLDSEDSKEEGNSEFLVPSGRKSASKQLEFQIKEKESTLAGLKAEIKSRQRLVSQMIDKNIDPDYQEKIKTLEEEIILRDRQMQVLSDRLIVLDAQVKEGNEFNSKQKDSYIAKLKEDLAKTNKDKDDMEAKIKTSEIAWKNEKKKWDAEKEKLGKSQENAENLKKDHEKLVGELQEAQSGRRKAQVSMEEMQRTISEMHEKISTLTGDLDISSKKQFETNLKIQTNEELQRSMEEIAAALKRAENEIKAKNSEIEAVKLEKSRLENVCSEQSSKVEDVRFRLNEEAKRAKELENLLSSKESSYQGEVENITKQLNYAVDQLQQVKNELEEKKSLQEEVKSRIEQNSQYQNTIRALENQLRDKGSLVNVAQAQENTLKERIKELEKIISGLRKEKEADEKKLGEKTLNFENKLEKLLAKNRGLTEKIQEKDLEISKVQSQISAILSSNEEIKKKSEQALQKLLNFEQIYREMKAKYEIMGKEKEEGEKTLSLRENQIREALSRIKQSENDIFTRDSAILQKESIILRLHKEIEENKRALQQAHSKFRNLLAEEMKNFASQLEQKDQEIKILKDMIRSGQTQIKQRNGELTRVKNMLQPQSSTRTLQDPKKKVERSENAVLTEKFANVFKEIENLRCFKNVKMQEITENSHISDPLIDSNDPVESINRLVNVQFEEIIGGLQRGLKSLMKKSVNIKAFSEKIVWDKEEITAKELFEIVSEMCP